MSFKNGYLAIALMGGLAVVGCSNTAAGAKKDAEINKDKAEAAADKAAAEAKPKAEEGAADTREAAAETRRRKPAPEGGPHGRGEPHQRRHLPRDQDRRAQGLGQDRNPA